jgi:DNA-binding transcriptional LysR family regulator
LDAKDLKVFEAVARCESMKRAATELNTVQSNVTARIRHLEEELGAPLFERKPNGIKLTPAGARLLPYAYEVRAALSNAQRAVTDAGTPCGPLVIGSRKSTSALHLTQLVAAYVGAYPEVEVRVTTETTPLLTAAVLDRRLEGAFVCAPIDHPDLIAETVFDEELVVLTAPQIKRLEQLSPDNSRMIVLTEGSMYEHELRAILARRGFPNPRVMALGTVENIIECVEMGLGITLLPRDVLNSSPKLNLLRAHAITDRDCRVQTVFIRRRDGFVSSALAAFVDCAQSYARESGKTAKLKGKAAAV